MDPLSIASAIVTFWQAGMRLKASVDKISHNRRRTAELLEDIVQFLTAIKNFGDEHQDNLRGAASAELKDSLDQLTRSMLLVCRRCDRIMQRSKPGVFCRLSAGYALWKEADDIELELIRLKEVTAASLSRIQLLIAVRGELALAQLEQDVLVSCEASRSHVRQLDNLFCQLVCATDSKYIGVQTNNIRDLDDICRQYIQLKLASIRDALLEGPRQVFIPSGTFSLSTSAYTTIRSKSHLIPTFSLVGLLKRLSHASMHLLPEARNPWLNFPIVSIIELIDDLSRFGIGTIVSSCFHCLLQHLRFTHRLTQSSSLKRELLYWVAFVLDGLQKSSPMSLLLARDFLEASRALQRLPCSKDDTLCGKHSLTKGYAAGYVGFAMNGDYSGTLAFSNEVVWQLMPRYKSGISIPETDPELYAIVYAATNVQRNVSILFRNAMVVGRDRDFSQARYITKDTMALIDDLAQYADALPADFGTCADVRTHVTERTPTRADITQKPNLPALDIQEPDAGSESRNDGNDYFIEWGIAI